MVSTRSTTLAKLIDSPSTTTSRTIDNESSNDRLTLPSVSTMTPSIPSFFAIFTSLLITSPLAFLALLALLIYDIDPIHGDSTNYTGILFILFYWVSISLGRAQAPKTVNTIISTFSVLSFLFTVVTLGTCVFKAVHDKPGFPNSEAWTPVAFLTTKCVAHVRETGRLSDPYPCGAAYEVIKAVGKTAFKVTMEQAIARQQEMMVAASQVAGSG